MKKQKQKNLRKQIPLSFSSMIQNWFHEKIQLISRTSSFRGEHLAVRNDEGSYYLCLACQNIYRHSKKIKIQWLGLATENNPEKNIYIPEYYDTTGELNFESLKSKFYKYEAFLRYISEFETILTSLEIKRVEKKKYQLDNAEQQRIEKILQKAVDKETGKLSDNDDSLTEDNPEGRKYFWFSLVFKAIWNFFFS